MGMTASCPYPVILVLPGLSTCDAIGQVFRRFNGGVADSLALFYEATVASGGRAMSMNDRH
jgi:hypothetical protein